MKSGKLRQVAGYWPLAVLLWEWHPAHRQLCVGHGCARCDLVKAGSVDELLLICSPALLVRHATDA